MNQHIEELLKKSTYDVLGVKQVDQKQFAELIVRECAKVARNQTLEKYHGMVSNYTGVVFVEEAIKNHFGVEE